MNLKNGPLEEGFMSILNTVGGVVTLFRTLAIIIIVYYVLRWLAKIFAPILMKRMVNKMQQKAQQQQQYNQHRQNTTQAREGETIIDKKPNTPKQSSDDVGEYVDFEEID
jgi:flagellar biosynthesis/type III secretory pathway M-ring protein FliF/YscJ